MVQSGEGGGSKDTPDFRAGKFLSTTKVQINTLLERMRFCRPFLSVCRSAAAILLILLFSMGLALAGTISGDAELRGMVRGKPLILKTHHRVAGAIDSLVWDGVEFIDSADHGRQLQSAVNADVDGQLWNECYNPTEAGSVVDGAGPASSSVLEALSVQNGILTTRVRMAYWLAPGMSSGGHRALNSAYLSDHRLSKRVKLGFGDLDTVIDYRVTYRVPSDRPHRRITIEALTGYMPARFSEALAWNPDKATLEPLPWNPPGEIAHPVVLSTPSGSHAMGVFTPDRPADGNPPVGYGRFEFQREGVVKWNCVFRLTSSVPLRPGDRSFQFYVVLGSREDCRRSLEVLHRRFSRR